MPSSHITIERLAADAEPAALRSAFGLVLRTLPPTTALDLATTTMFAAYEVATGKVMTRHEKRRRRKEFVAFMDEVVAAYPGNRLEVVMDNLNTHKKNDEWLARHPLVTFHFTPTRASWLNQVEC